MPSPFPGVCKACGDDFAKVNRLREYCTCCQSIRDITYRAAMKKTCWICDGTFHPIKSNYTTCPSCQLKEEPDKYDACVNCKKHFRPAPGLKAWCLCCVQSSDEARQRYGKALIKRREGLLATRSVEAAQEARAAEIAAYVPPVME